MADDQRTEPVEQTVGSTPLAQGDEPAREREQQEGQAQEGAGEQPKAEDDVLEIILPSDDPRPQKVGNKTYVQRPLSYFRKMAFFRLLVRALKRAIDDGGAEVVAELFGGADGEPQDRMIGALSQADFNDADSFLRFIVSLADNAPDLLEDSYCIWLSVPPLDREWAKDAMRGDIEGVEGLSDEDGVAIMKTFIVQNWGAMQRFFGQHAVEIAQVAREQQRRLAAADGR